MPASAEELVSAIRRMIAVSLSAMLLVAVAAPSRAEAADASTSSPVCDAAAELRERLEGVTEGVIDGRLAAVPHAADRASAWWTAHRTEFASAPSLDTLMRQLVTAAHHQRTRQAASLAVRLSAESFAWCPSAHSDSDALMLLDLAGMTGWLRGRGQALEWPAGVPAATDSLAAHLVVHRHPSSATRLRSAVAALLAAHEGPRGDVLPATRLLELIDQLEQVLR